MGGDAAGAAIGGGFIWHFQDQGLYRHVPARAYPGLPAALEDVPKEIGDINANVWVAQDRVLDGAGDRGEDGIVYADRFPQANYWVTRKVYAQIVIPVDEVQINASTRRIELPVENRYDFTDLEKLSATWWLTVDGKAQGEKQPVALSLAPRAQGRLGLDLAPPADLANREIELNLAFHDPHGRAVYEKTVRLLPDGRKPDFAARLEQRAAAPLKTGREGRTTRVAQALFEVRLDGATGRISVAGREESAPLFEGPIIRVGRPASMAEIKNFPADHRFWKKYFLPDGRLLKHEVIDQGGKVVLHTVSDYPRQDEGHKGESVEADVTITVCPEGWIDVVYALTPRHASGFFLELGLGFTLPPEMGELTWLGQGPYCSSWQQSEGKERGIWHIYPRPITDAAGRLYPGNREGVDLATVTNQAGGGIGVLADSAIVSLEDTGRNTIFSQIAVSAGRGNKTGGMLTLHSIPANEVGTVKGAFRIVPLAAKGKWAEPFETLLRPALAQR